jgi:hypothetical protein
MFFAATEAQTYHRRVVKLRFFSPYFEYQDLFVKGKCALGPFLSILVIECQHKWTYVKWWTKYKSSIKVCFSDLVYYFRD